jgi:hypothetical protein
MDHAEIVDHTPQVSVWSKMSTDELNNIYRTMVRSSASRGSFTMKEVELELYSRIKEDVEA